MYSKKRKSYTSQYKAKVALDAVRGTKTLSELAQEYTVHPTQVSEWKKELLTRAFKLFEIKRGPKAEDSDTSYDCSNAARLKMKLIGRNKIPTPVSRLKLLK